MGSGLTSLNYHFAGIIQVIPIMNRGKHVWHADFILGLTCARLTSAPCTSPPTSIWFTGPSRLLFTSDSTLDISRAKAIQIRWNILCQHLLMKIPVWVFYMNWLNKERRGRNKLLRLITSFLDGKLATITNIWERLRDKHTLCV